MMRGVSWVAMLLCTLVLAADGRIEVARFTHGDLQGWEPQHFAGETRYEMVREESGRVLRADSNASASGLVRRMTIDLATTPTLNWSWRVNNILTGNDEHTRAGDDYPVRVYVIFSGGLFFWRTRAINYVWSSHQPPGATWPNAFTRQARMIAIDSGPAMVGEWRAHSRNIREDYRQLFGEEIAQADAVAIMSDTDNTGQRVVAWYGDIWFSAQ